MGERPEVPPWIARSDLLARTHATTPSDGARGHRDDGPRRDRPPDLRTAQWRARPLLLGGAASLAIALTGAVVLSKDSGPSDGGRPGTMTDVRSSGETVDPDSEQATQDPATEPPTTEAGEAASGTDDPAGQATPGDEATTPGPGGDGSGTATGPGAGPGSGDGEFADSSTVEFEGFAPGSPEAVTALFFDAISRSDCNVLVDLWAQSYADQLGATRQEQLQSCEQMFQFAEAPTFDPASIAVRSQDAATAVVAVRVTVDGTPTDEELHLVMESGWKVDLLGGG